MQGHEIIDSSPTKVAGKAAKEVSYSVGLFFDKEKSASVYTFQKRQTDKKFVTVKDTEDLFLLNQEKDELRICIEENVGWINDIEDKCELIKKKRLKEKIDVYLPLIIGIVKREGNSVSDFTIEKDLAGQEMLHVLIEVIDPSEEIDMIKGPRGKAGSKTGKDFVKSLTHSYVGGDNCYGDFVPSVFKKTSRSIRDEGALSLVYDKNRNLLKKYARSDGRSQAIIPVRTREMWGTKLEWVGVVKLYFNPPPIAGDNYKIKISLVERDRGLYKKVQLKQKKDGGSLEEVDCFETPTITIWRKMKLQMLAVQEGIQPENIVKWDEIKGAYRDAFIEFEGPKKILQIKNKKWMKYLWRGIYSRGWRTKLFRAYRKTQDWKKDLKEYSFPQRPKLIPPQENKNNDATSFLGSILGLIIKDEYKSWNYKDVQSGFLALICKPPSNKTSPFGSAFPLKAFFVVQGGDATRMFTHELGHCLFLNHGATKFTGPPYSNIPFISTLRAHAGSDGPFWDEHDNEDMISCVMSYKTDYYNQGFDFSSGASAEPQLMYTPLSSDKRVDWHFCGLCLLFLRLYDIRSSWKSASGSDLRKMLYKGPPKIAWGKIVSRKVEDPEKKKKEKIVWSLEVNDKGDPPILHPPLKKKKGKTKKGTPPKYGFYPLNKSRLYMLALYPPETSMAGIPVKNNYEMAFWKDVSATKVFKRGRWRSTKPNVAKVKGVKIGGKWIAFVQAKKLPPKVEKRETEIYYQIRRGVDWSNTADIEDSKRIKIIVKRRVTKKEKRDETTPPLLLPPIELKVNEKKDS